jgi:hypothetical protein
MCAGAVVLSAFVGCSANESGSAVTSNPADTRAPKEATIDKAGFGGKPGSDFMWSTWKRLSQDAEGEQLA